MNPITTNSTATEPCAALKAQLVNCQNTMQRFSVEFIAFFSNKVLLVTMPKAPNAGFLIKHGGRFQLRFTVNNIVYTFNTEVLRICQQPYICLSICNLERLPIENQILQQLSA